MLDEPNPLVKVFHCASVVLEERKGIDINIRIIGAKKVTKYHIRCRT
jgi:hypothetical protein